ncbi:MAG TPA: 3-isopropylmalate dehydratase large subunit [Deltaproteobacteria bacterium]|nr:3-isopropylmalate dehydratase large subunit [Deltaproteobacteria bacterium]
MTITEKILASHAGVDLVRPGEMVQVKVDLALANDITAPLAINVFNELGVKTVFDRHKVALVQDHFVPNKDIPSAEQAKVMKEFALEHRVTHYFDLGDSGIEHVILPEKGLVVPGDVVIGADSHTCTYGALGAFSAGVGSTDLGVIMATGTVWLKVPETIKLVYDGRLGPWVGGKDLILFTLGLIGTQVYKTLEFSGPLIPHLSMSDRLTMANMAVEAGAKSGIFEPDEITKKYLENRTEKEGVYFFSDPNAGYERIVPINVDDMEPQIACPSNPNNVNPISQVERVALDQVFIGSCTNGRLEDLQIAADLLKGKSVCRGVRLIVIPGSPAVYKEAIKRGIVETLLDSGAVIGPPTCGPCLGGHMGVLARGEKALSTSNRNFVGRMGHAESEVYLASPAVAAASAVFGRIAGPSEL